MQMDTSEYLKVDIEDTDPGYVSIQEKHLRYRSQEYFSHIDTIVRRSNIAALESTPFRWTHSLRTSISTDEPIYLDQNTTDQRFAYSYFNTSNNDTEVWVNHLKPSRIYTFKVRAWNAQGPSNYSQPSFYTLTEMELPETIVFFTARSISPTVLHLTWDAPTDEKVNGEFLGYRLTWAEVARPNKTMKEMFIRNASANSWLLTNLWPATDYFMELQVFNPKGNGPPTRMYGRTTDGVPLPPRDLKVLNVTDKTMTVGWKAPRRATGVNKGYRVYYTHDNSTDEKSLYDDPLNETLSMKLENLLPETNYSIRIKAFTQEHEGAFSGFIYGQTDMRGPPAPDLKNVSCDYNNTLRVVVGKPRSSKHKIYSYFINVMSGGAPYSKYEFPTNGDDPIEFSYLCENITTRMEYEVQVTAGIISPRTGHLVLGEKSDIKTAYVTDGCRLYKSGMSKELYAGIVAGTFCVGALILLGGVGYLIWRIKKGSPKLPTPRRERQDRKLFKAPYYYLDNAQCTPANLDWNQVPESSDAEDFSGPIKLEEFTLHVQKLHADGDIGFSKEYEAIQNDPNNDVNTCESSQHPENKPKNRYLNIIAYDHSRVQLLPMTNQKISTYINANYIDGFMLNKAYIGTQGPLPSTFDCFWRMIWEQRVTIIIMITNLVERGRRKCDMYWPKDGTEEYGLIQVTLVKEDVMATYTVRTLKIRHNKVRSKKDGSETEKMVYQYHYTNWPDHGTPDHPLPVISFVKKSSSVNPTSSGPMVVHCSAGVGRTGTYIVLDAMLKQIKARCEVNIYGFLKHIRAQRNFLVQTEEQYIFIHDAILEAILGGDTDVECDMFDRYLEVVEVGQEPQNEDEAVWKPLTEQYKQITSFVARDFNLVSANKPVNQPKNRCAILVPMESSRVHLTPKPGEDGSDYINASWLPGFHSLREYIITQHPQVKEDFWKMCWDHAVQMVVMLSLIDDEYGEYQVFWPEGEEIITTDLFTCRQIFVDAHAPFITKEYLLKSVQDDYEIKVKFIQSLNWPNQGVEDIDHMYDLPSYCQTLQKLGAGPICVVDRFGGNQAATFCALLTLKKHLEYEQKVDVYMYAKLYHNKRPNVWVTLEDYKKLHACVAALCRKQKQRNKENQTRQTEGVTEVVINANGLNGSVVATIEPQPCCSKSLDEMPSTSSMKSCNGSPELTSVEVIQALQGDEKPLRIPPEEQPLMGYYTNG